MANFMTAMVALAGVLIAGYLSNFVAEDYRRFREGSALAAALAGELSAYFGDAKRLLPLLKKIQTSIEKDTNLYQSRYPHEVPADGA